MDAVEDIKGRLAIEDVVSEYVQLKRAGRNFKGLSPFTSERTPSFIVSPEKGIWHDFSSGKGGNMFSFVMEMEGLDFRGALEHLARKAGVDLSKYQTGQSRDTGQRKERLYEALDLAAKFYQVQFSRSKLALDYVFKKREFTKEIALIFRLGYSPNNGDALLTFLKKQGFTEKEVTDAGLTARRYQGGIQDMFRGRLMVPLQDAQGRVIGFTARQLDEDPNAPKYINTPQTILYDKGRHIYGLHLAKEAIRKTGYAVLVEGNLDVIASHQAGVNQVVATAGTALTEMHLKGLKRFTGDLRLAFDQDKAGQSAAERAIPIASKAEVTLSMITIPAGKDPDELVRNDPKAWVDVIDKPQYALDWLIGRYKAQLDLNSAVGKREFSDVLLEVIRKLEDKVEQDHYIGKIAAMIGVSKEALSSKLRGLGDATTAPKRRSIVQPVADSHIFDAAKIQNHYLALLLLRPAFRTYNEHVTTDMLASESGQAMFTFLMQHPTFEGDPEILKQLWEGEPVETVQNLQDYVKMLSLLYEQLYKDLDEVELTYEISRLRIRLIEQFVKTKKTSLIEQLRVADEADTTSLLEQAKVLDTLLKITKEQS